MINKPAPFWKIKTFAEMTPEEWESLCDGCARCCLYKIEEEESLELIYTNIVCKFLDLKHCRCTVYPQRSQKMPTCVTLTPQNVYGLFWLPSTCAYKILANGENLEWWHPLVSGDPETVRAADISIYGKVIHEQMIDMEKLEDHSVDWIK
jgi:uncharacterized cysteine cluster protein YcgN (CxxCxxCC family)